MKFFIKISVYFLTLNITSVNAQNFQKVYPFEIGFSIFNSVYTLENQILVSGTVAAVNTFGIIQNSLIYLNKTGVLDSILRYGNLLTEHYIGFSNSKLATIDSSYLLSYRVLNYDFYFGVHGIQKINFDGSLRTEFVDTALINDSISFIDFSTSYVPDSKQFYYTFGSIQKSTDPQPGSSISLSALLNKYSDSDSLIWSKKILANNYRPKWPKGIFQKNEDQLNLVIQDFELGAFPTQYNSKLRFVDLDTNGNILGDRVFQPSTYTDAASGVQLVNNGANYLLTYSESKVGFLAGNNEMLIRPVVALLDSNLNVVWKDSICHFWYLASDGIEVYGQSPKDYVVVDSNFVFAHTLFYPDGYFDSLSFTSLFLQKRNINTGVPLWKRSFQYYRETTYYYPFYEIYDAAFVPYDSGYVFVGTSYNYDSIQAGAPGQLGYVLKTNCLGHLGDPVAGAQYIFNDSLGVQFTSTSLQDGSVTWYFGDSTSEQRGEYQDSVFHQYNSPGPRTITLVAHGCQGVKDTLQFTIDVPAYVPPPTEPKDSVTPTVVYTKTMSIGPNPVATGGQLSIYLGTLPTTGATLQIMDQTGKIIRQIYFNEGNTMNMLTIPFAAGVYEMVLLSNGKVLDKERLVVF